MFSPRSPWWDILKKKLEQNRISVQVLAIVVLISFQIDRSEQTVKNQIRLQTAGLYRKVMKERLVIFEPRHEKTGFLHMRKQRRRSALLYSLYR